MCKPATIEDSANFCHAATQVRLPQTSRGDSKEAQKLQLKLAWSANARLCSTLQDYLSNTYLVHGKTLTHKTPQKMNVQFDATFEHINLNFEYYSNLNNSNQFCLSCQGRINISWQYTSADNHNHAHAVSKSTLSNLSIQLCTLLF